MKKLISVIAVIALLCALGTTAFAVTLDNTANLDSHDVIAKFSESVITPDVYSVDVAWGAMQFTYSVSGTKNWNAGDHSYTNDFDTGWTAIGNTVTVTNHSNKVVTATFGFTKDDAITETITGNFSVDSEQLDAGAVGEYNMADKVESALTMSGVLDAEKTNFTKVGTVTVTIA